MAMPYVGSVGWYVGGASSRIVGDELIRNPLRAVPATPAWSVDWALIVYPPAVASAPMGSAPLYDQADVPAAASDTDTVCHAVPFQKAASAFRWIVIATDATPDAVSCDVPAMGGNTPWVVSLAGDEMTTVGPVRSTPTRRACSDSVAPVLSLVWYRIVVLPSSVTSTIAVSAWVVVSIGGPLGGTTE
jgi:hypothetical protein